MAKKMYCTSCGSTVKKKVRNRGSGIMLLFLLLCFIVPGIFYFLWMMTGYVDICRECKSENSLIPENSPQALMLKRQLQQLGG